MKYPSWLIKTKNLFACSSLVRWGDTKINNCPPFSQKVIFWIAYLKLKLCIAKPPRWQMYANNIKQYSRSNGEWGRKIYQSCEKQPGYHSPCNMPPKVFTCNLALLSSFLWASATYRGLLTTILLAIPASCNAQGHDISQIHIVQVKYYVKQTPTILGLTARDASSGVENATNPEPLLIPLGSRITCSTTWNKII